MSDLKQAAQQALEALIDAANVLSAPMFADAVDALKAALKQPEQEPAAREGFEKWAKFAAPYMDISRFEAGYSDCNTDYAWAGWKAALAQPQQQAEPVAWMRPSKDGYDSAFRDHSTVVRCTGNPWTGWVPLYTAPPQQQAELPTCAWSPEDEDFMPGTYRSACGELWSFIDGGWQDNRVRFCQGCGGKVVDAAHNIQEPKS